MNPYHTFLGLPESETKPDHYKLLGLARFADDQKLIRMAALSRNSQLRSWDNSKFHREANKLLDEVAEALLVLEDLRRKAEYDRDLRRRLGLGEKFAPAIRVETTGLTARPDVPTLPVAIPTEVVKMEGAGLNYDRLFLGISLGLIGAAVLVVAGFLVFRKPGLALVDSGQPAPLVASADRRPEVELKNKPELEPPSLDTEPKIEPEPTPDPLPTPRSSQSSSVLPLLTVPFTASEATFAQEAWAKSLGRKVVETNSLGMEFVLIPPGTFQMGSPADEAGRQDNEDQAEVTLTDATWLGKTEVTQGQWEQVMGTTPWKGKPYGKEGPDYVASYVSWDAAQEFAKMLSERESMTYRLPTEAEWEWSCRAGTATYWSFGDNAAFMSKSAWYLGNTGTEPHPHQVGLKLGNSFGLHDMHGNVWEWCADGYVAMLPGGTNPMARIGVDLRVMRGGSFGSDPKDARSAVRARDAPSLGSGFAGFRLLMDGVRPTSPVIPAKPLEPRPPDLTIPFTGAQAQAAQSAWAKSLGKKVLETNSLGMAFILIPPGTFPMGSPADEAGRQDHEDQVEVSLTDPIWLGKTEVTQDQWKQVMGTMPWRATTFAKEGPDYPASYISWSDAQEFVKKLSQRDGTSYRLPTEAEWEWSCRAGSAGRWNFGESEAAFTNYGWCNANTGTEQYPHQVGLKLGNPFGLHDMHGNMMEWCNDVYVAKLPGGRNPNVTIGGNLHVLRGGSWDTYPKEARCAWRFSISPGGQFGGTGFRLLMEGSQPASRRGID